MIKQKSPRPLVHGGAGFLSCTHLQAGAVPVGATALCCRYCVWLEVSAVEVGATVLCCLSGPYRRQASSHTNRADLEPCAVPVGAGLPAMGCV